MDKLELVQRFRTIENKREYLLNLLEKPNLGTLRLDVNQALEELDELIEQFEQVFPEEKK